MTHSSLAFPDSIDHWGCGFEGCSGYELEADLDFDTDGSGDAGAGDTYWNGGAGWAPIGIPEFFTFGAFNTTFDGNGHVIANLFVRGADFAGLFGALGQSGVIRNLSATDVDVVGVNSVGGLVGYNYGAVIASLTTGKVSGDLGGGGLVGVNDGTITRSRSFATATLMSVPRCSPPPCATPLYGYPGTGGLVGANWGDINSSYATGAVDGSTAGGLAGYNGATIVSSYATGPVTGTNVGGLVGRNGRGPGKDLRELCDRQRVGSAWCRRAGRGKLWTHRLQLCDRGRVGRGWQQLLHHRQLLGFDDIRHQWGKHDGPVAEAHRLQRDLRRMEPGLGP